MQSGLKINWLIVLLATSLLGITGIQAYWLHNAYEIKEQKFDRQVGEAVSEVAQRVENLESIRFLFESFSIQPFFSEKLNPAIGMPPHSDSAFNISDSERGLKLTIRLSDDTMLVFNSGDKEGGLRAYHTRDSMSREVIARNRPDQLMKKAQHLDFLLRKMVMYEMQRRSHPGRMINEKTLDSLLSFELKNRGIDVPYQFAVLSKDRKNFATEQWQPGQQQHKAALFPNDLLGSQVLAVSFPGKTNYLLRSMVFMFLISLLFTSAIMFAFWRTLRFSLQQKRISEIKTDFINNMTHEFKTPLATINLAIDSLRNPKILQNPEKVQHYGNVIKQENNRMNMQVESVLRMALMEKKELELNFEEVEMQALVEDCLEHIHLQLQNKDGRLQKFFNAGRHTFKADKNHLANAIINLLDNAMKYSQAAPQITVGTELTGHYFVLSVNDKGLGMTREEQKHIFDRFYRVSTGDLHNIKGHGLGLSYARGIVERHGGRIEVQSEKGKGSTFYVYLPLNPQS